jgi:hypothetical protein
MTLDVELENGADPVDCAYVEAFILLRMIALGWDGLYRFDA